MPYNLSNGLKEGREFETNRCFEILPSAVRNTAATIESPEFFNTFFRGLHLFIEITVNAGGVTITPSIIAVVDIGGISTDFTLVTLASDTGTGKFIHEIYPGISESVLPSNNRFSNTIPRIFKISMNHDIASDITYSVNGTLLL